MLVAQKLKKKKKIKGNIDFFILFLTLSLMCIGAVMIGSASSYWALSKFNDPYYFLKSEIKWIIMGIGVMAITCLFDYRKYKKFVPVILFITFTLLAAVLFIGTDINNARRWISLGFITIMPGEIAKFAAIICGAAYMSKKSVDINSIKSVGIIAIFTGAAVGLIMLQPNMSTGMTLVIVVAAMMFVAGLNYKWIGSVIGLMIVTVPLLVLTADYRQNRITSFIDPFKNASGDGFQGANSLLALGSGGLTGKGLGNSIQKYLYLPEPQTDFILAIIGEETGFIGIMIIVILYTLLIFACIRVVLRCRDKFGVLLGSGIVMMIGIQVVFNLAIVGSIAPSTGISLPFISFGGNALLIFCGCIGIILNISRRIDYEEGKAEAEKNKFVDKPLYSRRG